MALTKYSKQLQLDKQLFNCCWLHHHVPSMVQALGNKITKILKNSPECFSIYFFLFCALSSASYLHHQSSSVVHEFQQLLYGNHSGVLIECHIRRNNLERVSCKTCTFLQEKGICTQILAEFLQDSCNILARSYKNVKNKDLFCTNAHVLQDCFCWAVASFQFVKPQQR